jgi:Ser/Thr protein kinase RdoA (MazF antagonist)
MRSVPEAVLDAYGLREEGLRAVEAGLINATWHALASGGERCVLQRVNPIFPPQIHRDIEAVTRHLAAKGLTTPTLIAAASGATYVEHEGAVWRLMTFIDGISRDRLESAEQAAEAGRQLGRFHRALSDLRHEFVHARLGVHDTARHHRALREALDSYRSHPEYAVVRPLADELDRRVAALPPLPAAPDRIVHGDPKVSNIIFSRSDDRALALIDLDTLGKMPAALELGDALRSWCNTANEDAPEPHFDIERFAAALAGYAETSSGLLTPPEYEAVADAVRMITLELALRFCTDALRESYFAWDRRRFASASRHNQARARGQLQLALSIEARLPEMRALAARAFASAGCRRSGP